MHTLKTGVNIMTKFNGSRRFPNIKKINTKILSQIVDGEGRTDHGSDYGALLPEIIDELHRRQNANAIKEHKEHDKQLTLAELASKGKQCPKCEKYYSLDSIDANFYKVAGSATRYRPRCKACHVEASRINRTQAPF